MGNLPPFRQINFTDIPGAPAWFSNFLSAFNQYASAVYDIVNKGTTIGQQIPGQLNTVTVSTSSTGTFAAPSVASTLSGMPQAVMLARVRLLTGTGSTAVPISLNQWDYVAGSVLMTVVGMQPACTYQLTFLLL